MREPAKKRPSFGVFLKPTTKGFLFGLLSGVTLIIVVEVVAFFGLSLLAQRMMREGGGFPGMALPSARFPAPDRIAAYGNVDGDWVLETLDGEERSFDEFRGKTVFVNRWATWCSPCVSEMPGIEKLYRSIRNDDGLAMILVSEEDGEDVAGFLRRKEWELPVYISKATPDALASRGIPATFIVDSEGAVVFRHVGAADWSSEDCVAFLKQISR